LKRRSANSTREEIKENMRRVIRHAEKRRLTEKIIQVIKKLSDNGKSDLVPVFLKDILNKFENPSKHVDVTWWLNAWEDVTNLKGRYIPARAIGDLDYVETSIDNAKSLNIRDKSLLRILTPLTDKTIYGTASFSSRVCRASVKRQLHYLIHFLNLDKERVIKEAKSKTFFISLEDQNKVSFFTSIQARGIFALPEEIYELVGKQRLVFIKVLDKNNVERLYARTINFSTSKTRKPEPYLQIRELPKGIYYITLYNHKSFLSQQPEQNTNIQGYNFRIYRYTPLEQIQRSGRYLYDIGKAILSIGNDIHIPVNMQVDTKNNQINFTQTADDNKTILNITCPLSENKPIQLEIKYSGKNYPVTSIKRFLAYTENSVLSSAYIILGEMKRGNRVFRKKILISNENLITSSYDLSNFLTHIRPPTTLGAKIFTTLNLVNSNIRVHNLNIESYISLEFDEKVRQSLYYWYILKNPQEIGNIGERILEKFINIFIDFAAERKNVSKNNVFLLYQGKTKEKRRFRADYEIYRKDINDIIGFIEVSIGQDLKRILEKHLIEQIEERFRHTLYRNSLFGIGVAIEYSPSSRLGKMVFLIKEKEKDIVNITNYFYNKIIKRMNNEKVIL